MASVAAVGVRSSNHNVFKYNIDAKIKDKIKKIAYDIFSILFFPLGLYRIMQYAMHRFVSKQIMGSQHSDKRLQKILSAASKGLLINYNAKRYTLVTPDNEKLDAILFTQKNKSHFDNKSPLVIHFGGNNERYENHFYFPSLINDITNLDCNLLLFNPRGVSKSSGKVTLEGLKLDSETVYKFATDRLKVKEDNIRLHGHSFGGYFATYVKSKHSKAKLISDRSFISIEKAAYHLIKNIKPTSKIVRVIAFILSKLISFFGWQMNVKDLWANVIGSRCIVVVKTDHAIAYEASVAKNITDYSTKKIYLDEKVHHHCSALSESEWREVFSNLS